MSGDLECEGGGTSRTLLHVATDWPSHFPNGAATVAALIEAGANVNARFTGPNSSSETPLSWTASSDDAGVLDALLDSGGANRREKGRLLDEAVAMTRRHRKELDDRPD